MMSVRFRSDGDLRKCCLSLKLRMDFFLDITEFV